MSVTTPMMVMQCAHVAECTCGGWREHQCERDRSCTCRDSQSRQSHRFLLNGEYLNQRATKPVADGSQPFAAYGCDPETRTPMVPGQGRVFAGAARIHTQIHVRQRRERSVSSTINTQSPAYEFAATLCAKRVGIGAGSGGGRGIPEAAKAGPSSMLSDACPATSPLRSLTAGMSPSSGRPRRHQPPVPRIPASREDLRRPLNRRTHGACAGLLPPSAKRTRHRPNPQAQSGSAGSRQRPALRAPQAPSGRR